MHLLLTLLLLLLPVLVPLLVVLLLLAAVPTFPAFSSYSSSAASAACSLFLLLEWGLQCCVVLLCVALCYLVSLSESALLAGAG